MAGNQRRNVFLDFFINDTAARRGLQGVATEAGKTQGRFERLSGGAKALVGGFAALAATKVISFLGDAAQAAAEDQKAQELLALAVQNSTDATDLDIVKMEEWIEKVSFATGVADDELRPALAELARTTGDLETAQDTLGVAMDIATAKGLPLETVTKAIGKAALGNLGALGRLGVAIKTTAGEALTFDEILAEANRTMGGSTATAAETAAGQMQILRVRVDEAKEGIGNALIPILADLAQQGSDTMKVVGFLGDKIRDLIPDAAEGPLDTFGKAVLTLLDPVRGLGFVTGLAADQIDRVEEALPPASEALDDHRHAALRVRDAVDEATGSLEDFEDEVGSQMDPMFNLTRKLGDMETAQRDTATAREEYGEGSPEHLEALRKEAEAWMALKEAELKLKVESGLTAETYRSNLEAMGVYTRTEIDLMVADYERVIAAMNRVSDATPRSFNPRTGAPDLTPIRGTFHSGGVVPGSPGADVPIIAQAGETVLPRGQGAGINVSVTAGTVVGQGGMQQLAKIIRDELIKLQRQNGPLGFQ